MRRRELLPIAAGLLAMAVPTAQADEVIKIGNILALTGIGAAVGQHVQQAEELYLKLHSAELPKGVTIQLITRDTGSKPDEARRLAQEMIVRDHVQMLAGFVLSPEAFAVAPVITEAKMPTVIMNASTGSITRTSPYFVRFSHSNWQLSHTIGQWAPKNGFKTAYSLVADYAAGIDDGEAFAAGFTGAGGKLLGADRTPLSTTDYLPYMDRVKAARPQALFAFEITGSATVAMWKAYADAGLRAEGVTPVGTGDVVPEDELSQTGATALGMVAAAIYTRDLKTPENEAFLKAFYAQYGANSPVDFETVGGWNGMMGIFKVVQKLGAHATGDAAMDVFKGMKLAAPNGPIEIDPATRDIIQNVYLTKVEKQGDGYANVVFQTIPAVKDAWKELHPKS